jgi:hypothetical protein
MSGKIKCNNHNITNCKTYKIKDDKCMRHEIIICEECEHSDSKSGICKNCHGKIIVSEKQNFKKRKNDISLTSTIYRDHFYIDKDNKVADILEASNFFNETHNIVNKKTGISEKIKNIIIEYEVIDFNECSGCMHIPLLAADRPDTWKTICQNCKIRHKNNK